MDVGRHGFGQGDEIGGGRRRRARRTASAETSESEAEKQRNARRHPTDAAVLHSVCELDGEGGFLGGLVNLKGGAIRIGEAAGYASKGVNKVVEPVANFTKRIVKMDDSALMGLSNKLKVSTNPAFQKFGNALEKATQDSTKRDRLLWAISQQPAFRQMIQEEEANQEEQN